MTYLFYFAALAAIVYELTALFNTDKVFAYKETLKAKNADALNEREIFVSISMLLYFIWSFVGIFTSQWVLFLLLILLGFIPLKRFKAWMKIDAAISIAILMLIILNKYHLHIDVLASIKSCL
jgi:hypothetical protein